MPIPTPATVLALPHTKPLPCSIHCNEHCSTTRTTIAGPSSSPTPWPTTRAGPPVLAPTATCTGAYYRRIWPQIRLFKQDIDKNHVGSRFIVFTADLSERQVLSDKSAVNTINRDPTINFHIFLIYYVN